MAYTNASGAVRGTPVVLKASAAETTSTVGPSVPTGPDSGSLFLSVAVSAASGTTPTLLVTVEGSMDGTTWFTLGKVGANGYTVGSAASITAPTNFTAAATTLAIYDVPTFVRYNSAVGGTTPSFTYSVTGTSGL